MFILLLGVASCATAAPVQTVTTAINQFGLELHRQIARPDACTTARLVIFAPQTAFAAVRAGSAGTTRR
ncbi:MAG: hypothetical protein U1G08_05420 [Verrucomicrobiota bacterium]